MEQFVAWLLELSPVTVYAVIGASTLVENVFPPTPSDLLVALGGFLTQHGHVSWVTVWLIGWLANFAGSIIVYLLARRYGRQFLTSRLGQKLLPADAIVSLEKEYLRFGAAGIFLSRFLPGIRSFVAPFVGLINLHWFPALAPIALASAVWYAVITWAGARVGEEWESIIRFVNQLNRSLAIVGVILAVIVAIFLLLRRRKSPPPRDRLLRAVHRALGRIDVPGTEHADPATAGAATLLYELADADNQITPEERGMIEDYLRQRWGLGGEALNSLPGTRSPEHTSEMATLLSERYDRPRRLELMRLLFRIAQSDGTLSRHEERLMRRAGTLLGLGAADLQQARQPQAGTPEP
ncbi:MAG TPA: TerB family tellurite resistance protein [Gemmatimonadales bacterium]|nr:TerB family tellurite resistance protein [Gemmatimonadales bacterium]